MTSRRAFLLGGLAALAAPAVIRTPGLLMPIKPMFVYANIDHYPFTSTREVYARWLAAIDAQLASSRRQLRPYYELFPEIKTNGLHEWEAAAAANARLFA